MWVSIVLLNIITALMVDTFTAIRNKEQDRLMSLSNDCFVCGTQRHVYEEYSLSLQARLLELKKTLLASFAGRQPTNTFI